MKYILIFCLFVIIGWFKLIFDDIIYVFCYDLREYFVYDFLLKNI